MGELQPSNPVALRQRREATISKLCEHFAVDHLEADDLEKLIDRAHQSTTIAEMDALLENLPQLADLRGAPRATSVSEGSQTVLAIMGGAERAGGWISSRRLSVFALMGGAVLDFRDTPMPEGVTELEVYVIMGGVEVIVPPGLRVASDGFGLMGGFVHTGDPTSTPPGAASPLLRITGLALMGGVEITERQSGESAKDAARRIRNRSLPPGP
jgi:hypothetical protein